MLLADDDQLGFHVALPGPLVGGVDGVTVLDEPGEEVVCRILAGAQRPVLGAQLSGAC
ncbi:hypothetical protein ACWGI0_00195 [Streptomyces sp. NPDC054802]